MTFEFSGDDDVWIFVDDVLIADVGGNHMRIRVTVDFATGKITYYRNLGSDGIEGSPFLVGSSDINMKNTAETTLLNMFTLAGKDKDTAWNGNTFANNTIHTLKFFYLERGNSASNCNIKFNLLNPIVDRIRKVDQDGEPLAGAEFKLYAAKRAATPNKDELWLYTADDFVKDDSKPEIPVPITTATSSGKGYASLTNANGEPLDLANLSEYYILEETKTPEGYRKNKPIVLQYQPSTKTLIVVNKYEVGAYASYVTDWTGNDELYYADETFQKTDEKVSTAAVRDGLAIVVPMVYKGSKWLPMYGSNTLGWKTEEHDGSERGLMEALTKAAIRQIADSKEKSDMDDKEDKTQHWYLRWDDNEERLKGTLENLPGDATRYIDEKGENGNIIKSADGKLVTILLTEDTLKNLGLTDNASYSGDEARYAALADKLRGKKNDNDVNTLFGQIRTLPRMLYTDGGFVKNNRTVIYVPNEQRELRVRKVGENDTDLLEGAVFALFDNLDDAIDGDSVTSAGVVAYGTTGENGELVFRAGPITDEKDTSGYAYMNWDSARTADTKTYWLKEIIPPKDHSLNKKLVRVEVGNDAIYANATGYDPVKSDYEKGDVSIRVEASLGRLNQTLVKYAEGIVDETLKYITITKQETNGLTTDNGIKWNDEPNVIENLIYKNNGYSPKNADKTDYGRFTVTDDYIRVMPRQTQNIQNTTANRNELGKTTNLDGLFCLINTVVVKDQRTGSLTVSKKVVEGNDNHEITDDTDFTFSVKLSDVTFNKNYVDEKGREIKFVNGYATFSLKNGESVTFDGLPVGYTYTVTEADATKLGYRLIEGDNGVEKSIVAKLDGQEGQKEEFINEKTVLPTGALTVSKKVVASDGGTIDPKAVFTFNVVLSDNTIEIKSTGSKEITLKNGKATFTLKDTEFVTFSGIPAGVTYTVTEELGNNPDDYKVTSKNATGTIAAGTEPTNAEFTNTTPGEKELDTTGKLTVSKEVRGNANEDTTEFPFRVEFSGNFTDGAIKITAPSGKKIELKGGVAEFTLKDKESVTFSEIPSRVTYAVTEVFSGGYKASSDNATGTIIGGREAVAKFTNEIYDDPNKGKLTIIKEVDVPIDDEFSFIVTLSDPSFNGTYISPSGKPIHFVGGVATLSLKGGQLLTLNNLTPNVTFTVTEADSNGYTVEVTDDTGTTAKGAKISGTTKANNTVVVKFTNTKKKGSLTVRKAIEESNNTEIDQNQEFGFTLKLTNLPNFTDIYKPNEDNIKFENGEAKFTLKHGESITIENFLPVGATYKIVEDDTNGYIVASSINATGAIGNDTKVEFFNKPVGSLTVKKRALPNDPNSDFSFYVTLKDQNDNQLDLNRTYIFKESINSKIVRFEKGVSSVFTLKPNQSITLTELPANIKYTVTEVGAEAKGYTPKPDNADGTITAGSNPVAAFTNEKTGTLTVIKVVRDANNNSIVNNMDFNFTVNLFDESFNRTYFFTDDLNNTHRDIIFKNGIANFTLKDGEHVTFTEIPEGTPYEVIETPVEGFTTSTQIGEEKLVNGTTAEGTLIGEHINAQVRFYNKITVKNDPTFTPEEPSRPGGSYYPGGIGGRPGSSRDPSDPDGPDDPDDPGEPDEPNVPDDPGKPDEPNVPDKPDIPNKPDVPDEPDAPDTPGVPDDPNVSNDPNAAMPDFPGGPNNPDESRNPNESYETPPESPDAPYDNPNTGDKMFWFVTMGLSLLASIATVKPGRKRGKHRKY